MYIPPFSPQWNLMASKAFLGQGFQSRYLLVLFCISDLAKSGCYGSWNMHITTAVSFSFAFQINSSTGLLSPTCEKTPLNHFLKRD